MSKKKQEKPEAVEGEAPPSKSKKKIIAIIATVLILTLGVVGAKGMLGGKKEKPGVKKVLKEGSQLPLDEFMVNLSGPGDHYLRTTITLGIAKGVESSTTSTQIAQIRDAVLNVLTNETVQDISTDKGREELKKMLEAGCNAEIHKDEVVNVYFTEFAYQ